MLKIITMKKIRNYISYFGAFCFVWGSLSTLLKYIGFLNIITIILTTLISIFLVKSYFVPPCKNA